VEKYIKYGTFVMDIIFMAPNTAATGCYQNKHIMLEDAKSGLKRC